MRTYLLLFALLLTGAAGAQKIRKEDKQLLANLQKHVAFLASDSLEGRRTGTRGEQLASAYISKEFSAMGLMPKGTSGYLQPFEIQEGKGINPATILMVEGQSLRLNRDFFPLVYSPNITIEALPSMGLQEMGMPWFFDLKEVLEANKSNPHFNVEEAVKTKAQEYKRKGATALFIYNTSSLGDGLSFKGRDGSAPLEIPVIYLAREAVQKYFSDPSATLDIRLKTDISAKSRKGTNVAGYIDNGAPATVVIGAHYDHLGLGEDGNSMVRTGGKEIHNGADDNASGTSALLELARMLKASRLKGNNYLFIAFSGEELGLYGSKYFTENPTINLATVNYMINMDMIGRLKEEENTITVGGFGTSPAWSQAYGQTGKNKLYSGPLQFKFDSTGTGPSDHTSFYRKDIPVLFYFTGLHTDYHRPSDDADKLNYNGQLQVVRHIFSLLEWGNKSAGKVAFSKTREMQMGTTASFSVTLGIMPDYTFGGNGVRVDGVSESRPAQKAGLKGGDVILQLGTHPTTSVEHYMQALGAFKKGDKTTVSFERNGQKLSAPIEF